MSGRAVENQNGRLEVGGSDRIGSTDSTAQPLSLAKDDAFHILQHPRRRAVLRYILEHDGQEQFVLRDVAEEVAAWEHDTTVEELTSDDLQRVYISLYHAHLHKLDRHDIVEYDQDRGLVESTERTPTLAPYLGDGLHADSELLIADSPPHKTVEEDQWTLKNAILSLFTEVRDG